MCPALSWEVSRYFGVDVDADETPQRAAAIDTTVQVEDWVVSRCGLVCNTCPAYKIGICGGCPSLSTGECVIRDCVDRQGIASCAECTRSSCYHWEAYAARRQAVKLMTKDAIRRERFAYYLSGNPAGSCGTGGCGSGCGTGSCGTSGGCGGCSIVANLKERIKAGLKTNVFNVIEPPPGQAPIVVLPSEGGTMKGTPAAESDGAPRDGTQAGPASSACSSCALAKLATARA